MRKSEKSEKSEKEVRKLFDHFHTISVIKYYLISIESHTISIFQYYLTLMLFRIITTVLHCLI